MSATADLATSSRAAPWRGWVGVRLLLLVCSAAAVVGALGWGERPATPADLEAALGVGRVSTVQVRGSIPPGATGSISQEARWREGWRRFRTDVRLVAGSEPAGAPADPGVPVTTRDLGDVVRSLDPAVRVERPDFPSGARAGVDLVGVTAPGWVLVLVLFQGLAGLFVLVNGPPPWRATRWGWFWLSWLPFGWTAFLLLSGPLRVSTGWPGVGRSRLGGGWAFVLSLALGAVVGGSGAL